MTLNESHHEVGWYVQHHDGVVHGPYQENSLIDGAKLGHFAPDTAILHPIKTENRWIAASSVPAIAKHLPPPLPVAPAVSPILVSVNGQRYRSKHFRWSTVLGYVIPSIISLALIALATNRIPQVRQMVFADPKKESSVLKEFRDPEPKKQRPSIRPNDHARPEPKSGIADPPMGPPAEPKAETESLNPAPTINESRVSLKLSLERERWIAPLESVARSSQLFFERVEPNAVAIRILPTEGKLSADSTTLVTFEGLGGLAIRLRIEYPENPGGDWSVVGDWICPTEESDQAKFSIRRMKNRERYLAKNLGQAQAMVDAALSEKAQLEGFLKSFQTKRLEDRGKAKNRLMVIEKQLASLNQARSIQQGLLDQFSMFVGGVSQLQDSGQLVIRVVADHGQVRLGDDVVN